MKKLSQIPSALCIYDVEAACRAARKQLAPAVKAWRAQGAKVSFYQESIIATFPPALGGCILVHNCLRGFETGKIVPSIEAAMGMVQGRVLARKFDWRDVRRKRGWACPK